MKKASFRFLEAHKAAGQLTALLLSSTSQLLLSKCKGKQQTGIGMYKEGVTL